MTSKKYKCSVSASVHETVEGLYSAGLVDKRTMRDFDERCLTEVQPLSAEEIRQIRLGAEVSQRVFAYYLNVSPGVVSQWERGEKHPRGSSLKLLLIVRNRGLEAIA